MSHAKYEEFYKIKNTQIYKQDSYQISNKDLKYEYTIATHYWSNNNKNLIVMQHGYTDNCAYTKPIQEYFLRKNYDVICLELPGHGMSSGMTANIINMYAYQDMIETFIDHYDFNKYHNIDFFGHSTGTFGLMLHLLDGKNHPFQRIVFAAPLVRSYLWNLSRIGVRLFGKFIWRLPRRGQSKKHPIYREIAKNDPRPIRSVPINWAMQLMNWNKFYEYGSQNSFEELKIIFGTSDTVIDYPYNRMFLEDHFPNSEIQTIKGSDHAFHFETPANTQKFYNYLDSIFK